MSAKVSLAEMPIPLYVNLTGDELRSWPCFGTVAQMGRKDNRQSIAYEISAKAICVIFVSGNVGECLTIVWVSEEDDRRDMSGNGSRYLLNSKVDDLCALTVEL